MIWLLLFLALGIFAAWLVSQATETSLEDARKEPRGQFVMLPDGQTHFDWHGPENGRVMVCIHGLSTPSYVWHALIPHLTAQGFRVLTYDLYGRGLSDRSRGPQTREFFLRQLRGLLASQGIDTAVTLCGYSMGGHIATARTLEAPDSVTQLILIAPAGLGHGLDRLSEMATRLPILGDWIQAVIVPIIYHRLTAQTARDSEAGAMIAERLQHDLRIEGTMAAMLSSQRNMLDEDLGDDHRLIAAAGTPVLAIWGGEDPVIPISGMGRLAQQNRAAQQIMIEEGTHALPWTHPERIAEAIDETL